MKESCTLRQHHADAITWSAGVARSCVVYRDMLDGTRSDGEASPDRTHGSHYGKVAVN